MLKSKPFIIRTLSMFLLFVAAAGVKPACMCFWYQPKMPE
jgi:hypothetical protein